MEIPKLNLKSKDIILFTVGTITAISLIKALSDDKNNVFWTVRACVKNTRDETLCEPGDKPVPDLPLKVELNGNTVIMKTDMSGIIKIPKGEASWSLDRPPADYPLDWFATIGGDNDVREGELDYLFIDPSQPLLP